MQEAWPAQVGNRGVLSGNRGVLSGDRGVLSGEPWPDIIQRMMQLADLRLYLSCRFHVPSSAWQAGQAITVDTSRGAIDLEPATEQEYVMWVLGLNAAMTAAQEPQALQDVPGSELLWSPDAFVMSN